MAWDVPSVTQSGSCPADGVWLRVAQLLALQASGVEAMAEGASLLLIDPDIWGRLGRGIFLALLARAEAVAVAVAAVDVDIVRLGARCTRHCPCYVSAAWFI